MNDRQRSSSPDVQVVPTASDSPTSSQGRSTLRRSSSSLRENSLPGTHFTNKQTICTPLSAVNRDTRPAPKASYFAAQRSYGSGRIPGFVGGPPRLTPHTHASQDSPPLSRTHPHAPSAQGASGAAAELRRQQASMSHSSHTVPVDVTATQAAARASYVTTDSNKRIKLDSPTNRAVNTSDHPIAVSPETVCALDITFFDNGSVFGCTKGSKLRLFSDRVEVDLYIESSTTVRVETYHEVWSCGQLRSLRTCDELNLLVLWGKNKKRLGPGELTCDFAFVFDRKSNHDLIRWLQSIDGRPIAEKVDPISRGECWRTGGIAELLRRAGQLPDPFSSSQKRTPSTPSLMRRVSRPQESPSESRLRLSRPSVLEFQPAQRPVAKSIDDEVETLTAPPQQRRSARQLSKFLESEATQPSVPVLIWPGGPGSITVYSDDQRRLYTEDFLNDTLVDFFLKWYLNKDAENEGLKSDVYIFSTFFFDRLTKDGAGINHKAVEKWTRKSGIDLFKKRFVIVPINESAHWYVMVIVNLNKVEFEEDKERRRKEEEERRLRNTIDLDDDSPDNSLVQSPFFAKKRSMKDKVTEIVRSSSNSPRAIVQHQVRQQPSRKIKEIPEPDQPMILMLDSLGASHNHTYKKLRSYLEAEAAAQGKTLNARDELPGYKSVSLPMQDNFYDCGVYLIHYIKALVSRPQDVLEELLQPRGSHSVAATGSSPARTETFWRMRENTELRAQLARELQSAIEQFPIALQQSSGPEAPEADDADTLFELTEAQMAEEELQRKSEEPPLADQGDEQAEKQTEHESENASVQAQQPASEPFADDNKTNFAPEAVADVPQEDMMQTNDLPSYSTRDGPEDELIASSPASAELPPSERHISISNSLSLDRAASRGTSTARTQSSSDVSEAGEGVIQVASDIENDDSDDPDRSLTDHNIGRPRLHTKLVERPRNATDKIATIPASLAVRAPVRVRALPTEDSDSDECTSRDRRPVSSRVVFTDARRRNAHTYGSRHSGGGGKRLHIPIVPEPPSSPDTPPPSRTSAHTKKTINSIPIDVD
ncbi:hypothetical protein PYCC9005_000137 [Savitreella phatthalungensis]